MLIFSFICVWVIDWILYSNTEVFLIFGIFTCFGIFFYNLINNYLEYLNELAVFEDKNVYNMLVALKEKFQIIDVNSNELILNSSGGYKFKFLSQDVLEVISDSLAISSVVKSRFNYYSKIMGSVRYTLNSYGFNEKINLKANFNKKLFLDNGRYSDSDLICPGYNDFNLPADYRYYFYQSIDSNDAITYENVLDCLEALELYYVYQRDITSSNSTGFSHLSFIHFLG